MAKIIEEIVLKVVIDGSKAKQSLGQINTETEKADKNAKTLLRTLRAIGAGSIAFGLFKIAKATAETNARFDSINKSLLTTTGNITNAESEMDFLRSTADKLGINLLKSADSYSKFIAAIKGTNITLEQGRELFLGISEAGTALGITSDDLAGALRAVQQIASKGRVSLEELTGQLGERLPSAVQLLADELGVTRQELLKMAEDGELMAEDILPQLGSALRKAFSKDAMNAASGARAELNRLSNAWDDLKNRIGDTASGAVPLTTRAVKGLDVILASLQGRTKSVEKEMSGFGRGLTSVIDGIRELDVGVKNLFQDKITFSASEVADSLKPVPDAVKFLNKELSETEKRMSEINIFAKDISDLFKEEFELSLFDKLTQSRLKTAQTALGLDDEKFKKISKVLKQAFKEAGNDADKVGTVFDKIFDLANDPDFMKRFESKKKGEGFFEGIFGDVRKNALKTKNVFQEARDNFDNSFKDIDLAKKFDIPADQFSKFQSFLNKARKSFTEDFIEQELKKMQEAGLFGNKKDEFVGGGSATAIRAGTSDVSNFLKQNKMAIANFEANERAANSLERIEQEIKEKGIVGFGGSI